MSEAVNLVILNHGRFGEELIKSAELIVGKTEHIKAISLLAGMSIEEYYEEVKTYLSSLDTEILVMVDLYGGTPSNVGMMLQREFPMHVLCGVNLPMLIELILLRNNQKGSVKEWLKSVVESTRKAILIPEQIEMKEE